MNFTENLPGSGEYHWVNINRDTGKISQIQQAIFKPLLYTCTCFWKYGQWKISAVKTKFSSRSIKRAQSGISRFDWHKDQYNALELKIFAPDTKSAKEQCRQLLKESAFLRYVSHSKPLLRTNYFAVIQAMVELY